ncbi:MAG: hypothetical protein ABR612_04285 [Chromatocurvus sp.]
MNNTLPVFFLAMMAATALCVVYRQRAAAAGWLAHPEARSSHRVATVSGAGVAVFSALSLSLLLVGPPLPWAGFVLLITSALLSLLGLADDLAHLGVRLRLGLYALAASLTALWLCSPGQSPSDWAFAGLAALWILAFINLFNFMDGIDGLAALQALSASLVLGVLAALQGASDWYVAFCLATAGAFTGLLFLNFPPARLFMGDAGSIPGGYLLASLLVAGWCIEGIPIYPGLILLALFIADSVTTLVFRLWRREAVWQAHRQHLYQRLALCWQSHRRVDLLFLTVQWFWLAPLALVASLQPGHAAVLVVLAYLPLLIAMVKLRSIK